MLCVALLLRLIPAWLPLRSTQPLEFTVHRPAIVLAVALALLATLAASLPALRASRAAETLRVRGGRTRSLAVEVMLGTQFAQAALLLICAGLLIRSTHSIRTLPAGFDPANTPLATLSVPVTAYDTTQARLLHEHLRDALLELPAVEAAAFSRTVPVIGEAAGEVAAEGASSPAPTPVIVESVSAGWCTALGRTLLEGEVWRDGERDVALVNAALAKQLWPDGDAVGRALILDGGTRLRVTGVTADGTNGGIATAALVMRPFDFQRRGSLTIVLRSRTRPALLQAQVRDAVRKLDPDIPVSALGSLTDVLDRAQLLQRAVTNLALLFGLLGLAVCGFGIYAQVDRHARSREREIGIRVALGATTTRAAAVVWRRAAWVGGAGAMVGGVLAAICGLLAARWLFGLHAFEPLVVGGALGFLALIAVLAAGGPVARASRHAPLHRITAD